MKLRPVTLPQVSNAQDIVFHLIFILLLNSRTPSLGIHILLSPSKDSIAQDSNLSAIKEGNYISMILGRTCFFSPKYPYKAKPSIFHSWMKEQTSSMLCFSHFLLSKINKLLPSQTIFLLMNKLVSGGTRLELEYLMYL